jgi:hypothetical protein
LIEDKTIRDTVRIYIDTKSITRDYKLKERNEEDAIIKSELERPIFQETDLDYNRVHGIIESYNKKYENPLSLLDAFRNKYNVPFSFTYTIKHKMHKAVLYIGGEICNI